MTHPTDDSLKPCPFCGSQPEPAPYVLKCVNAYCEAQPSVSGGNDDECATAWNKRALLAEQARTQTHKAEDAPSDAALADTPTPKPQGGLWTLTAPDGRTYQADSPLRCCGLEQRERVPADVAMARIFRAASEPDDSELLDWLEAHLFERKWSGTIGQPSGWYMAGPYRHTMQHMRGESLRAAIRAAIAQERKA